MTTKTLSLILMAAALTACGSSSDEESSGFLKFYNASPNSPAIYLTVDEDLDADEDDEVEQTFFGINYGGALSNQSLPTGNYFYELAWQDEDSNARSDLEIVIEDQLSVNDDRITLLVMYDDILNPQTAFYDVPIEDDENDIDNDLFNLRFLNVATPTSALDIYLSKSDETFNEAVFMGSFGYLELSDNTKLEEDQYTFYITQPGGTEVVFESTEVSYPFNNQYIIVVRPNTSGGISPYVIDNVGPSSITEYQAVDAESRFRVFNGIQPNALLADYNGSINATFDSLDEQDISAINNLALGEFSDVKTVDDGDFSIDISDAVSNAELVKRQLVSLGENTTQTLFYYAVEVYVDDDGDGDFDEDGDGQIDEIDVRVESVVVENSARERIYDHEIELLNLIDSDDFNSVTVYFVKSDETIATAASRRTTTLGVPTSLTLRNNTYDVFAIAEIDNTDIILGSMVVTLDENSVEQFLILQTDSTAASGFSMQLFNQIAQ